MKNAWGMSIIFGVFAIFILIAFESDFEKPKIQVKAETQDDAKAKEQLVRIAKELPAYLKISGLPNAQLFYDMDASTTNDLTEKIRRDRYYAIVLKNPIDYHKLVDDDRIYDKTTCQLLFQYHAYRFFKFNRTIDDIKSDFLGSFLHKYHNLTVSETDQLINESTAY